jgi:hypothetical protein
MTSTTARAAILNESIVMILKLLSFAVRRAEFGILCQRNRGFATGINALFVATRAHIP